jgi:chromatin segregation and condensation protein Rec8/ScpA/Scc1 (kleisin family)
LARLHAAGGAITFRDLFNAPRDRYYIVSVFLCLLEMLKARRIEVTAGRDVVDLTVRLKAPEEAAPSRLP